MFNIMHKNVVFGHLKDDCDPKEKYIHININSTNLPGAHLLLVFLGIPCSQAYPKQKKQK